jgi:hypothetical protein
VTSRITETHDRPRIIGYCVGGEDDTQPCGKPLASGKYFKQLGVYEHKGKMRCDACQRRDARKAARLAKAVEYLVDAVDLSWQDGAACAGVSDPEAFTQELSCQRVPDEVTAAAWKYCAGCPIAARCSAEADRHLDVGLRGGVFRVLKPRLSAGDPRRYKRYDLLAGEKPFQPPVRSAA